MARPVRIDVAGGWYLVTNRGNERRAVFRDDKDRLRFLELLAALPVRFAVRIHAYVLLDNHFHLCVETPAANLSQIMQWLQVAYTVWFNRRHRRVGHLFQGRFHAVLLDVAAAWEVSRYVHLNPVRVRGLGLDKASQQQARLGLGPASSAAAITERLQRLRQYRWSSYRAYSGVTAATAWLTCDTVLKLGGGRGRGDRQRTYRQYVEAAVREGLTASPWERLEAGLLLGSAEFVRRMKQLATGDRREQPQLQRLQTRPSWAAIRVAVEAARHESWEQFCDRHGDSGRDLALYLGRGRGGLSMKELAAAAGGVDYRAVAKAVDRFARRLAGERELQAVHQQAATYLSNVQT